MEVLPNSVITETVRKVGGSCYFKISKPLMVFLELRHLDQLAQTIKIEDGRKYIIVEKVKV